MILEYHRIDEPEGRWTRTPENFRRDLETLHARGYRLLALNDLLAGQIGTPAGTTPVVLTFDDSSPGQFRYLERQGDLEIDPRSAVGILEAFAVARPDFGRAATFFVLPGANRPNRLFDQPEHEGRKLRYLVSRGYEFGNHTLWHANLGQYGESTVRAQVAGAQEWIHRHVPGYRIRSLALPFGVYPRDVGWVLRGTVNGETYRHDAVLQVSGGAAPSPFSAAFDPVRLPRIQVVGGELSRQLAGFERRPEERFVSDGDPAVITIPPGHGRAVRTPPPGHVRVIERPAGGEPR
jgi:peptidoglycan/xylan/chitin deacetylase (PgdA/CDA1 family)